MTNEVVDKSWQELAREAQLEREEFRCKVIEQSAAIEQLHAAVKTAQELAATRLMEIGRLSKREKNLMDVIDSRDRALGFVPLDEVHASEPCEQQLQLPGPRVTSEDSVRQAAESSRPRELLAQQMEPDTSPLTHQEIFHAVNSWAAEIVRITAAVPVQCTQGASRDASPGSNAWADAKGGLPDNTL